MNNIKSPVFTSDLPTLNVIDKLFKKWLNNAERLMINLPDISNICTNSVECTQTGKTFNLNVELINEKFIKNLTLKF
jgi:broad specificity polyphosphatase/5'/3'-nucleotidase SurE